MSASFSCTFKVSAPQAGRYLTAAIERFRLLCSLSFRNEIMNNDTRKSKKKNIFAESAGDARWASVATLGAANVNCENFCHEESQRILNDFSGGAAMVP